MNGRAYDYNLGRFLSVDPFIQAPGNSQSMNPYSYIMNNPLSGTDPSGYISIAQGETRLWDKWNKRFDVLAGFTNGGDRPGSGGQNNAQAKEDRSIVSKIESQGKRALVLDYGALVAARNIDDSELLALVLPLPGLPPFPIPLPGQPPGGGVPDLDSVPGDISDRVKIPNWFNFGTKTSTSASTATKSKSKQKEEENPEYVYRALSARDLENIRNERGILPKSWMGTGGGGGRPTLTLEEHILYGSEELADGADPYIATSLQLNIVLSRFNSSNGVVRIRKNNGGFYASDRLPSHSRARGIAEHDEEWTFDRPINNFEIEWVVQPTSK